jgi:excisionase family DNA binding protein
MELTVKEAALRLGVTPGRIRQLVAEGRITPRYVNPRLMLIDEAQLTKPTIVDRPRAAKPPKRKGRPRMDTTPNAAHRSISKELAERHNRAFNKVAKTFLPGGFAKLRAKASPEMLQQIEYLESLPALLGRIEQIEMALKLEDGDALDISERMARLARTVKQITAKKIQ